MIRSSRKLKTVSKILIIVALVLATMVGIFLGTAIAATRNIEIVERLREFQPALPTQIFDSQNRLITELFGEEKRKMVSIDELPKHLIYALITREDQDFFTHGGFSLRGTLRAAWNVITGQYFSGGSTITQQLAGHLYANRTDISVTRKLVELWWAFQLERSLTKYEILEQYLNKMYFGAGTYGVEAASQFYFGHSAKNLSLAESVVLVIQLSNTVLYNPFKNPNRLKKIQREIMDQMVSLGYTTKEDADSSYDEYWSGFDYQRSASSSAFRERTDQAPYFSEYIRGQLDELLPGARDIYRDGFSVYTTLNLDYQKAAERFMAEGLQKTNAEYLSSTKRRMQFAETSFTPILNMLALTFNVRDLSARGNRNKLNARRRFITHLNPIIDVTANIFGIDQLKKATRSTWEEQRRITQRTQVEGALICLDNTTGQILAMVGGSGFERTNQFNRAVQAEIQPGSAFKPLYYAAAIETRKITAATMVYDSPMVFWNDDGTPYTPLNFKGEWRGSVLARYALAHSMNVPSLVILQKVGFDDAIRVSSRLLGITDPARIERSFPRRIPLGLGIITAAPIEVARAFAVFANLGKEVTPIGIRTIEDRAGKIIAEPLRDAVRAVDLRGTQAQVISKQTAYIMTSMLRSTVESGTLAGAAGSVGGFTMPMAGKTGTTQNWSDVWAVGYSPYFTTAVWFGFDQPGNSLGVSVTGAVSAGPVWARFMKEIHRDLQPREFPKPMDGLVEMTISSRSGLIPPAGYTGPVYREYFLAGTEPRRLDDVQAFEQERDEQMRRKMEESLRGQEFNPSGGGLQLPSLPEALR